MNCFQTDSRSFVLQEEQAPPKSLEPTINSRQGLSRNKKSVKFQRMILVPTAHAKWVDTLQVSCKWQDRHWTICFLEACYKNGKKAESNCRQSKVHSFFGVIAFLQHPKILSAFKMEGFQQTSRETTHIVGGQHVESIYVKRSDPEKPRTFPWATTKLCNRPENGSLRLFLHNRLLQFCTIPRQRIPQNILRLRNVFWGKPTPNRSLHHMPTHSKATRLVVSMCLWRGTTWSQRDRGCLSKLNMKRRMLMACCLMFL